MDGLINLLHLEDDSADAKLVQATLEEAGLDYSITLVQTREAFEAALVDVEMDIILADYSLPMFDGISALRMVQETGLEVPFIFVSGKMGEEAAIAALTQGATDYVLKNDLARLASAVKRALQEARIRRDRKQAQAALQRTNDMLRAIIKAAPVAIIDLDLEGRVQSVWNPAAEKMLGWRAQEVIGKPLPTVSTYQQEDFKRIHEQVIQGVTLDGVEVRRQRRDGTPIDYCVYASPLHDTHGAISGNIAVLVDITERKRTEIRLNEQLHFLQQLIDSIPIPVYYKDRQGIYLGCNAAFEVFIDLPREEIVGKTVHEVVPKARADKHHEADLALLRYPGVQTYEINGILQDGQHHDVIFNKATFVDADAHVAGTVGTLVDITERKQAERERLANFRFFESMERVNQAIQGTDDLEEMMRAMLDTVLAIFDCDRAFLMYPCDPEAPTWRIPMERHKPEYPGAMESQRETAMDPQMAESLRMLLDAEGPVCFGPDTPNALPEDVSVQFSVRSLMSMTIYPKTGGPWQFGIHQCANPRVWTTEEMRMLEAIGRRLADSLSSLLSYRDLRNNEKFLENVIEHIPNMIFVKDAQDLRFIRFNKAGEGLLGYPRETLLGKNDHDFFPKEEADFFTAKDRQVLESKQTVDIPEEIIHNRKNEERILHTKKIPILDESGAPQYLLGISEDITKRKVLEAQFRQVQKMEAIGQLAGGIAHDFNNILSAITGYTEISASIVEADSPVSEYLTQVLEASQRAKELINQILMFSREAEQELKPIRVSLPVKEALKLIRASLPASIEIHSKILSQTSALADPTQIHQIVMNLCTNAAHAMRENGGRLEVLLTDIAIDDKGNRNHYTDVKPGDYIRLSVADQGHGIDPHHLHRIFDPFFTTKETGEGTGMGLSVVHGIVKSYGGSIYVHSQLGEGSTFEILIPALEPAIPGAPVLEKPIPTGSESILFVDDETMIVEIVKKMLETLGYRVTVRTSAIEALEAFKNHPDNFDLVITDMIMPKMSGLDLAEKIHEIRPSFPIVLCTGFSIKMQDDAVARQSVRDIIYKPILRREIATVVRKVLDQR